MSNLAIPFNISLLAITPNILTGLRPVTSLNIFDGSSNNFDENGLFSTSIFGKVGDERRDCLFSYIDFKLEVFHPLIYKTLIKLKVLYGEIMAGKTFAIWNDTIKDFERSNQLEGQTGFHFFFSNFKNINFIETNSDINTQQIKLIKTSIENNTYSSKQIIVMPAGLRDLEYDDHGKINENEINLLYRKILSTSKIINETSIKNSPESMNTARFQIQKVFYEIYTLISNTIEGKEKLIMKKWASRQIFYGSRNVITAMDTSVPVLGSKNTIRFNNTGIGLFQFLKTTLPLSIYLIRNNYLSSLFTSGNQVNLVNRKTLKSELVTLTTAEYELWGSPDGIEKIIDRYSEESLRHKEIIINDHYLALIYKGPDKTFKIFNSIDELPEGKNISDVYPITLTELLYCSVYKRAEKTPVVTTRYPVTGIGSVYPSIVFLMTTTKSEIRHELNELWEKDEENVAPSFPIKDIPFVNSMVPHISRISNLGADFDGDQMNCNATFSDESSKEVLDFLSSKRAYVSTDNKLINSTNIDTIQRVVFNLVSDI